MKTYALFQQYIWLVNTIHKAENGITLEAITVFGLVQQNSGGFECIKSWLAGLKHTLGNTGAKTCFKQERCRSWNWPDYQSTQGFAHEPLFPPRYTFFLRK